MLSHIIRIPRFFGGEGGEGSPHDVGTNYEAVVNDIFDRGGETQSKDDADWDKDTGEQDQSKATEREEAGDGKSDQGDESGETDSTEDEAEAEEKDDSKFQLPAKQAKEYPDPVVEHFAKRLNATLADVKGNPALKTAVKQLIDNAIFAEQQNVKIAELEKSGEEEFPVKVEAKAEEKVAAAKTPEEEFKQYDDNLTALVKRVNDPRMVDALVKARASTWGINLDDPKQVEALKAKGIDLRAGVEADTKAAVNLFNTVAPMFMSEWIESSFPGFGKMYENALHGVVWEEVAGAKEFAATKLPGYGTEEFNSKFSELLKANPWIDEMKFTDKQGRLLPVQQQITRKYKVAAQLLAGQKPDMATVETALETGRKEAKKADVKKKSAGNLGAGKSSGEFGDGKAKLKGSGLGIVEEYEKRKQGF